MADDGKEYAGGQSCSVMGMRSSEYLRAVEEALRGYDDEMVKELLASLNEHFEQGLSEGRSEEELCQELGAVEDLVSELNTMGNDKLENAQKKERVFSAEEQHKAYGEYSDQRTGIFEDVSKGETQMQTALAMRANPQGHPVSKIHAELGFADVKLLYTEEAVPYIRLQHGSDEPENVRLEECFEGDTYKVKLVKNERAQSHERRSILGQIFDGLANGTAFMGIGVHLALELYIPPETKELCVKLSSGDISADALNVPCLKLTTASGDIALRQVRADVLEAASASGDVDMENVFGTSINAGSTSGDADMENVKAVKLNVHSTSGDLDVRDCMADEKLTLNTMSGDIRLENADTGYLESNTISGDVALGAHCAKAVLGSTSGDLEVVLSQDTNVRLNTVSGDLNIRLENGQRGFYAETHTVSGDVHVRYAGGSEHYGKNAVIHIGDESSRLEIHSVSGDIFISG